MAPEFIDTLLLVVGAYAAIGLVVGVVLVTARLGAVDPAAAGARWSVRLLLLPGCLAVWPLMLPRLIVPRKRP